MASAIDNTMSNSRLTYSFQRRTIPGKPVPSRSNCRKNNSRREEQSQEEQLSMQLILEEQFNNMDSGVLRVVCNFGAKTPAAYENGLLQ